MKGKYAPTNKVTAATLGGALATILVWVIQATSGVEVPVEVGMSFATVCAFALGWLVPEGR